MGNGVIDVEDGIVRNRLSTDNGAEGGDLNPSPSDVSVAQDDGSIVEPHVGMEFESEGAAKAFYEEYGRQVGFSSKICQAGRFKPDSSVMSKEFVCCREGSKKRLYDGCDAMLKIEQKGNKWTVSKFVKSHNHALESLTRVLSTRLHRHNAIPVKNAAESCHASGLVPSGVMCVSMDNNNGFQSSAEVNRGVKSITPLDSCRPVRSTNCSNYAALRPCLKKKTFGKDAQSMLDYFKKMQAENPGFFYAIQLDDDNRMANVFWSDARSRTAYSHFGDVVILEASYRVNQCKVPFVSFSGVNHHGQPILFGCALLLDDSEASFVWLLKTFLTAMSDHCPVSIITDQDRAIHTAVSQVLPEARHCISKWHVLREGQERLAHVCLTYPNFQVELYNCINLTETIEEFESSWLSIIEKYNLGKNDWLQSIYNARRQWVPVYFRDSFFAAVAPDQGVDCSFFEGRVNQQTTLPMFFRQYERAMEYWFEKEIEAEFDTISNSPVLKTPSPMEKQAASLYTRKIFAKFQEELVDTFVYTANLIDADGATSTYQVAKFEDDQKLFTVTLHTSDCKASCSCRMFEYSGILCRHILTVFTVTNVLTLPIHYILRRWTRNAKSVVASDELRADPARESKASRYNSLCREAFRYSEEGAFSSETYTAAVFALRELSKRVDAVKKQVTDIDPDPPQGVAIGYDDKKSSIADTPLLWPQQDEVACRFNLNDSATVAHPVSDMNLLRMAPTTLQRDNGPSDSMVVLPCLKSMTWVMENKNSAPADRVAIISLKLQAYNKTPAVESDIKFQLSRITLEPMLRSMAYISEQLSTPVNRVAVINLKLQDTETISGESEVKFQVSRDTLGAMLRSMAYIREQLSAAVEHLAEPASKKQRKQ